MNDFLLELKWLFLQKGLWYAIKSRLNGEHASAKEYERMLNIARADIRKRHADERAVAKFEAEDQVALEHARQARKVC